MPTQVAIVKKNYPRLKHSFQLLTVLVLVAAGVYCYFQYQKLAEAQTALADEQSRMSSMQASVDQYSRSFDDLKKAADADSAEITNKIQGVYPLEENYTALTRMLDVFFKDNDKPSNPIFAGSLSFSEPVVDANKDYAVLPFTMSIEGTRENFEKFLRYVEGSGELGGNVRLMDIKMISLNFPAEAAAAFTVSPEAGAAENLNVSVSMDAYFQKPSAFNRPAAAAQTAQAVQTAATLSSNT